MVCEEVFETRVRHVWRVSGGGRSFPRRPHGPAVVGTVLPRRGLTRPFHLLGGSLSLLNGRAAEEAFRAVQRWPGWLPGPARLPPPALTVTLATFPSFSSASAREWARPQHPKPVPELAFLFPRPGLGLPAEVSTRAVCTGFFDTLWSAGPGLIFKREDSKLFWNVNV